MSPVELPPGSHYASMWGLADNYAGMTSSMLQRSRAFTDIAGVDVTILTFEHREGYDETRRRLREDGAMSARMHLRNMWEDLQAWDDRQLQAAASTLHGEPRRQWRPLGDRGVATSPLIRELRRDDGRHIQLDYFRPDGTMLMSDRRFGENLQRRSTVLCDTRGEPMGAWRRVSRLYWAWLDSLPRDPIAWIIADSKTSAKPLVRYVRDDVVKLHVVRGSHLDREDGVPTDRLSDQRRAIMEHIDAWDGVVFLTATQRDDVAGLLGDPGNLAVIPNSRNVPSEPPTQQRNAGRGVMVASLEERKRVQHAIRAMARARGWRLWWKGRLHVWGRGPIKRKLRLLIGLKLAPVRLHGYEAGAAKHFATGSYSLLTSSGEGLPGVLIESMGRGCIPISYDMPYGPADIITDGVDGFLVPNGDIDALAERIKDVVAAPTAGLESMRLAGHRRAQEFSDVRVVRLWADLLTEIAAKRGL